MNKKKLIVFIFFGLCFYLLVNFVIGKEKFNYLKSFLNNEQKQLIKKYIFPFKLISLQEEKLLMKESYYKELEFKENGGDTIVFRDLKLSNGMMLNRLKLQGGFYSAINYKVESGTGYIDFFDDTIFVLSARGVLVYSENILEESNFRLKQITNNINDFINIKQFNKDRLFSLKDMLIYKNKIFVSFTEEIKDDCWNTSIIYGDISFENIKFKKLYSPKECVSSKDNIDNQFTPYPSGGRIEGFNNDSILFTVGEYRERHLAQNKNSVNGKILKINIINGSYQIISMGHRNPQGLYYDKEHNFILETEHGPQGGDEINLIEINEINNNEILNYGWPIVSAGEHYGGRIHENEKTYKKYPLYKSHTEYGFIEPLKEFVPSIGISEVTKINKNKYVAGSMPDKSLYFFELNNEKKLINLQRVEVYERIRDLKFKNNKLYLFLENTGSIGIVNID